MSQMQKIKVEVGVGKFYKIERVKGRIDLDGIIQRGLEAFENASKKFLPEGFKTSAPEVAPLS